MKEVKEDDAFGPGMMFGIPGPGPKADRKPIPSDPKKEKGIDIKSKKKMKNLLTFEDFVYENNSLNEAISKNEILTKVIDLRFEVGEEIGKVEDKITLAMSFDSTGVFKIGKDIEKFCGIPEADVIRDVKSGKETPEDAIIYGLCNVMNGGSDIYFWTNGTRLSGAASNVGIWPAIIEQISHECGHLARLILTRAIAKNKNVNITNEDWITYNYGAGEYMWPAIGDANNKNSLIQIEEESFTTAVGNIAQIITPAFLEMAKSYIKDLKI